jgi:hypothetical protein
LTQGAKRAVSISLGSSRRNKASEITLLGERIHLERVGTDGSLEEFGRLFGEYDGKADALGVGGADVWLVAGGRRHAFKEIERLISAAKTTPVVDGSGLKHTLERDAISWLQNQGQVDFANSRVLVVSAADRFGLAEALSQACPNVTYGDLCFGLGLPLPIRNFEALTRVGNALLPIVTRLPFRWFYPTGSQQDARKPKFPKLFLEADIIAGDWHYIRRYAPDQLEGKTIITQTVRKDDIAWLKGAGVSLLVTTTPEVEGETFATNVMEAALVAVTGERNLSPERLRTIIQEVGWMPRIFRPQDS